MLIQSDAFNLPYKSKTFHACVTSPPYYGLRKYSGEQGERPLGLEDTAEEHIERMVVIFREVYRVLRDDGVLWMNYGDAFEDGNLMMLPHRLAIALQADGWIVRNDLVWFKRNPMPESVAGWRWEASPCDCATAEREAFIKEFEKKGVPRHRAVDLKPSQIPHKKDCPKCHGTGKVGEPVLRKSSWRHTRAHEYVFQLVKGMGYFCNQEVVREIANTAGDNRKARAKENHKSMPLNERAGIRPGEVKYDLSGRNPRSVLNVPTAPYKGAHYATFPPKLIAPLIRASVPRRCCPECGMAWAPVVEKGGLSAYNERGRHGYTADKLDENCYDQGSNRARDGHMPGRHFPSTVTDYRPTCECGVTQHEPGIVLDIFGGSGTTGMVAKDLLRRWVVMDISRPYLDEQAKIRTGTGTPSSALEGLPMFGGEDENESADMATGRNG